MIKKVQSIYHLTDKDIKSTPSKSAYLAQEKSNHLLLGNMD